MLELGRFTSHSGLALPWKIDCDTLTNDEISSIAIIIAVKFTFSTVLGIPRGGLRLAEALRSYCDPDAGNLLLIVDDVLTTGASMEEARAGRDANGVVIFSRTTKVAPWIHPIFTVSDWAQNW